MIWALIVNPNWIRERSSALGLHPGLPLREDRRARVQRAKGAGRPRGVYPEVFRGPAVFAPWGDSAPSRQPEFKPLNFKAFIHTPQSRKGELFGPLSTLSARVLVCEARTWEIQ
jgi:hypothetical protein